MNKYTQTSDTTSNGLIISFHFSFSASFRLPSMLKTFPAFSSLTVALPFFSGFISERVYSVVLSPGKAFVAKKAAELPLHEQVTLEPELEEALKNATDAEMCDIAGWTNFITITMINIKPHNDLLICVALIAGLESLLRPLVPPVLFPLWQVKMSAGFWMWFIWEQWRLRKALQQESLYPVNIKFSQFGQSLTTVFICTTENWTL